jgi:2-C-methyl-D-erythritol 2,4-cyclodiphosphate synthase
MRIGFGYDVHAFATGRKLVLGGVEIPFEKGLLGHSDADVLLHAVMDALLGAAALGDIGQLFPDSEARYKDISSLLLLEQVVELLKTKCYTCNNLDCTIVAQVPKLAPYRDEMRKRLAAALGVDPEQVSIKATTTEGLGFTGRKEGIAAYAVCTLARTGRKEANGQAGNPGN